MPKISPLPDWADSDVYVIGGGPSLDHFDFDRLKGKRTIGCNQAFKLGAEICNICTFGDVRFWNAFHADLDSAYDGWVATNYFMGEESQPPWLHFIKRLDHGLSKTDLAWNGNTGAMSLALALRLGAARVFLLGMDCRAEGKETHWHHTPIEPQNDDNYLRFAAAFLTVAKAIPEVYPPGRQVFNVSEGGSSRLRAFPICTFEEASLAEATAEVDVSHLALDLEPG